MWPPVLLLAWRWKHGPLLLALAVLIASFAANVALTPDHALAAFYLPVTRFWELMVGCAAGDRDRRGSGRDLGRSLFASRKSFARHEAAVRAAPAPGSACC